MTKQELINRANVIIENSTTYDYCELRVKTNDWQNHGKDRTYISIVEKSTDSKTSKHYNEKKYGYLDNITGEYVPERYNNLQKNYNFSGNQF